MSLNHLVKPTQEPKYDIFVRDIDAEGVAVDDLEVKDDVLVGGNINADGDITSTAGVMFAPLIASNIYVDYRNIYSDNTYATNDYIYDSLTPNGWNSVGDVKTFISATASSGTSQPYIETYSINIDGNIDNFAPTVFEFRSRDGFDELLDIKTQVSNGDGLGLGDWSSVGNVVRPPDNLDNDFQFFMPPVNYFATTVPPASSNAILTIEIKVLIQPAPP